MDYNDADIFRIGFVVILHTHEHPGEAALWAVPAARAREMAHAIAYEATPKEAILVLGPAKLELVDDLLKKLTQTLRDAGVDVVGESLADD
jgi:hypothetical protein